MSQFPEPPGPPPSQPGPPPSPQPHGASVGPQPPGPGRPRRTALLAGGITLALVAAVGGAWFALDDDGAGDNDNAKSAEEDRNGARETAAPGKLLYSVKGESAGATRGGAFWVADEILAKETGTSLVGYAKKSGQRKWTLPLGDGICAASQQVTDDAKAAVLYRSDEDRCSRLAVVDVVTGKKVWERKAPTHSVTDAGVTISEGTVAVNGGAAWSLADGEVRWKRQSSGSCDVDGYAGGVQLVEVLRCEGGSGDETGRVRMLDPATGKPKYSHTLLGQDGASVISTDPVVISQRGAGAMDFVVLDEEGQKQSEFSLQTEDIASDSHPGWSDVVGEDYLYAMVEDTDVPGSKIVSFDLDSGEKKSTLAKKNHYFRPVSAQDGKLIAYAAANPVEKRPGRTVSVEPEFGKASEITRHPKETLAQEQKLGLRAKQFHYEDGTLYLGRVLPEGQRSVALMAFGQR